jgi:hypothetical protein
MTQSGQLQSLTLPGLTDRSVLFADIGEWAADRQVTTRNGPWRGQTSEIRLCSICAKSGVCGWC